MATIHYGETVGVFSSSSAVRLDIGIGAVKKEVPENHDSWATRLKIKRLDGPNFGPVSDEHKVGIFSEDMNWRLDIGIDAMKQEVPADHESWATHLVIKKLDAPKDVGEVQYGDTVGIYSEDGRCRLDIGIDAMKKQVPANHDSWATGLNIKSADPAVFYLELLTYDTTEDVDKYIKKTWIDDLDSELVDNPSEEVQEPSINRSKDITETSSWSTSIGVKLGTKADFKTGIPVIAEGKIEVSVEFSVDLTLGGSVSITKNWGYDVPVRTPPHHTYLCKVTVLVSEIYVPFTMKGILEHIKSGTREITEIDGTYDGITSYQLQAKYYDVTKKWAAFGHKDNWKAHINELIQGAREVSPAAAGIKMINSYV